MDAKTAHQALGKINYETKSSEEANLKFRRSLYFISDMEAGSVITNMDIKSVRPGYGIAPKYFDDLIGKTVKSKINAGTPTSWDIIN